MIYARNQGQKHVQQAIYLHSEREHVTYRIYQLLPEQRTALLYFLTGDAAPSSSFVTGWHLNAPAPHEGFTFPSQHSWIGIMFD
jgi:hypothetical protein